MLFCCHRYFDNTEKRALKNTLTRTDQLLEIGTCPICKTKRVHYDYVLNGRKQKPIEKKGKKADKLIKELSNQEYLEIIDLKVAYGTKTNMQWLFQTNGIIKDFNNTTKGSCRTEIVNIKAEYSNAPQLAGALF